MAFTVSTIVKTNLGDTNLAIFRVTADAATGSFDSGYNVIKHASYMVEAMASAPTANLPVLKYNAGVSATAILGTIAMTNCVSGDIYHVNAYTPA